MIDESRFTAEALRMQDMLYRTAVSILRHDADAQDAVQQALENAWKHRHRVEPDFFAPWLMRIVINCCKEQLRKRSWETASDQMDLYGGETPPPDPDLADALARLPIKYRMPLLLHYLEGFSLEEIAQTLRLPMNTVKSRMRRARLKLRAEWNEAEDAR